MCVRNMHPSYSELPFNPHFPLAFTRTFSFLSRCVQGTPRGTLSIIVHHCIFSAKWEILLFLASTTQPRVGTEGFFLTPSPGPEIERQREQERERRDVFPTRYVYRFTRLRRHKGLRTRGGIKKKKQKKKNSDAVESSRQKFKLLVKLLETASIC